MFANVLIGVDGRAGGREAIELARRLAGAGAKLTLAHVDGAAGGKGATAEHEDALALLARERSASGVEAMLEVCSGRLVGRGLQRLAIERGADLLVVGSCHRGPIGRVLFGDDTSDTLAGAPCAVAIAPHGYAAGARLSLIGVGYDRSPESEIAVALGRELALAHQADLTVFGVRSLHAVPRGAAPAAEPLETRDGTEVHTTYGHPGEQLAVFGERLDVLIVGSRSLGPVGRLMHGSTANYLAREANCPLIVLPRSAISESAGRPSIHETQSLP
jgi:nucleotide-binding universal stress UspA family protein